MRESNWRVHVYMLVCRYGAGHFLDASINCGSAQAQKPFAVGCTMGADAATEPPKQQKLAEVACLFCTTHVARCLCDTCSSYICYKCMNRKVETIWHGCHRAGSRTVTRCPTCVEELRLAKEAREAVWAERRIRLMEEWEAELVEIRARWYYRAFYGRRRTVDRLMDAFFIPASPY